jgi:hypothetical protein
VRIAPRGGWLIAGAAASFALVAVAFGVIVVGAPAYVYVLAPDRLVDLAREHSLAPTLATGLLAFIFAVFGCYGLAGAGLLELPATRVLVAAIGCIYTLRGLLIVPEMLMVHFLDRPVRALFFAVIALLIGAIHLVGVTLRWTALAPPPAANPPVR